MGPSGDLTWNDPCGHPYISGFVHFSTIYR